MGIGSVGNEGSVLDPQYLQELRTGRNDSGQRVDTAPGSVHTPAEIEQTRQRAAERLAKGEFSLQDEGGVYGRDNLRRSAPPKDGVGSL